MLTTVVVHLFNTNQKLTPYPLSNTDGRNHNTGHCFWMQLPYSSGSWLKIQRLCIHSSCHTGESWTGRIKFILVNTFVTTQLTITSRLWLKQVEQGIDKLLKARLGKVFWFVVQRKASSWAHAKISQLLPPERSQSNQWSARQSEEYLQLNWKPSSSENAWITIF